MNLLIRAIILSLLFHILIIAISLFYILAPTSLEPNREINVRFQIVQTPTITTKPAKPRQKPILSKKQIESNLPKLKNSLANDNFLAGIDSTKADTSFHIELEQIHLNSLSYLIRRQLAQMNFDSLYIVSQNQKPPQIGLDIKNVPIPKDRIAERLRNENLGLSPMVNISNALAALNKSRQKKALSKIDFIPSRVQLQALKVIWDNKSATLSDIYSEMDSSFLVTAELVEKELTALTEKNLISRKKVSPQNEFNLFGIMIEMDELNRLNPVYAYSPKISRDEMMTFLQARLYLAQEQKKTKDKNYSKELEDKIQQLLP